MMKVMHVLKTNKFSGAESVAISIIKATRDSAESVYVSPAGEIDQFLDRDGITHYRVDKLRISEIKKAVKAIKPDIIHAHDFSASIICACASHSTPVISHIHNNALWIRKVNARSLAYALSCSRYAKIIGVSESIIRDFCFGERFVSKFTVIHNPINKEKIGEMAGNHSEKYDIGFLGRMSEPKNPLFFVQIIKELKRTNRDIKAVMIGDGEQFEEVSESIRENELASNIRMVGFQSNPYQILNECKTLCMPSKWEGFGLAAEEAMVLGIPVVASRTGGLQEIVDETCGFLCSELSDYIRSFQRIFSDVEFYQSLCSGAYTRSKGFSELSDYKKIIESLYDEIKNS